jgi:hypothetical protein
MATHAADLRDSASDPLNLSPVSAADDMRTIMIYRVAWGAVCAGAAVALVVQIMLAVLGVGVGLSAVCPVAGNNPSGSTFSMAAELWSVASMLFAAGIGGYVAGRLCGKAVDSTSGYHGLISWALSTLVVVYLLSSAVSGLVGGAASALGSVVGGVGKTAATAAQTAAPALSNVTDPLAGIEQQVREASGGNDPAALRDAAVAAMRVVLTGDQAKAQEARERAAQALARAQNISIQEARTQVGQYEQQYRQAAEQAKQRALQAAETGRKATATSALFAFFALLLGVIAAWFGGREGTVMPVVTGGTAFATRQ